MPKTLREELGTIVVAPDLATYCPDLATWPTSWCGEARDVIPGERIVAVFTPLPLDLLAQGALAMSFHPIFMGWRYFPRSITFVSQVRVFIPPQLFDHLFPKQLAGNL